MEVLKKENVSFSRGPFRSAQSISVNHTWQEKGNCFQVVWRALSWEAAEAGINSLGQVRLGVKANCIVRVLTRDIEMDNTYLTFSELHNNSTEHLSWNINHIFVEKNSYTNT